MATSTLAMGDVQIAARDGHSVPHGTGLGPDGNPSDDPKEPQAPVDAVEIASLELPAFVRDVSEIKIHKKKHKRFTMADIGRLEQRLEQVEYYTSLSLLEQDTANLQVTDSDGLNRFKSGFFVDNFKKHDAHQIGHPDFSASIDQRDGILSEFSDCRQL